MKTLSILFAGLLIAGTLSAQNSASPAPTTNGRGGSVTSTPAKAGTQAPASAGQSNVKVGTPIKQQPVPPDRAKPMAPTMQPAPPTTKPVANAPKTKPVIQSTAAQEDKDGDHDGGREHSNNGKHKGEHAGGAKHAGGEKHD